MKIALLLIAFLFCLPPGSDAQICSGSLGDPIINITFGKNRGQLPPRSTEFEPGQGCPKKGQYALANLLFGCGEDRTWLMLAGDHTLDGNGNYMLVNAQSSDGITAPTVVYRDTARGLCTNVRYVFSAWVTNALQPITCGGSAVPASLYFKVFTLSGVLVDSIYTGNIPIIDEKKWIQFGLSFTVPANESDVVLVVSTNKKAGCGQAFAIDDITLRPCGPSVSATVNGSADPLTVCADYNKDFVLKGAYATGFVNPAVQWQSSVDTGRSWTDIPAAVSVDYTVAQKSSGVVLYRMVAAEAGNIHSPQCRFVSNVLTTTVRPLPPHNKPQNLLGCLGKDLFLPAKDPFADALVWSGPNGYSSTQEKAVVPQIAYRDTGLYRRMQDFRFGCTDVDSFYVNVFPSTTIMVPAEYAICEGQRVTLTASGDGRFLWEPATGLSNPQASNPVASPRDSTQYKVVLTNSYGCKDSALVSVNVYRNPEVHVGGDKTIVRGDSVLLQGDVKGTAVRYLWTPPLYMDNNAVFTPLVFPPVDTRYTLTAESTVGCGRAEGSVMVSVFNDIYVVNSFTPNNDGKNDRFRVVAADGYQLLKFQVFNRWGQLLYSARDLSGGWDGKANGNPQPEGSYVYFLQIKSSAGRIITKKGTVTLIR